MFGRVFGQFSPGSVGRVMAPSPIILQAPVGYRFNRIIVSDAQLQTLDTVPLTLGAAEPGRVLVPISFGIRTNKPGAAAWTTGPVIAVVREGNTTALMASNLSSLLNTAAPVNTSSMVGSINTGSLNLGTFNIIGKALQAKFTSVATKGGGASATMDVWLAYYSFQMTL